MSATGAKGPIREWDGLRVRDARCLSHFRRFAMKDREKPAEPVSPDEIENCAPDSVE